MEKDEFQRHLQDCELFDTLGEAEIAQILPLCTVKTFNEGEPIHQQGARMDSLCVVVEGSIALFRQAKTQVGAGWAEVAIDILSRGRVFGWSTLVRPHVATNAPRAMTKSQVIVIDGVGLRFLLEKDQAAGFAVMQRLSELLASRLRAAYSVLDNKI